MVDPTTSPVADRDASRRLRVLVEAPAPFSFSVKEAGRISECDVRLCPGPLNGHTCPLLHGAACPEITATDVVVASLGLDAEENRRVLGGIRTQHPGVPVVVLAWRSDLDRYGPLLDGCHVAMFPWTFRKLDAAIASAASALGRETPARA